jgi:serine/threonine protein kinase
MDNLLALPTGTELVGDYRIQRVLGAGGFGLTYLAREVPLDRSVTIKEYFPSDFAAREGTRSVRAKSLATEADYNWGLERFIEEAQTLAKFDHPNINRVYRYFQANNTAYMVLHFEEGESFKAWLANLGRAPRQAELDQVALPLLDALELIHAHDFLHRDIAPDNIIIRRDGAPVLIDFGSARGEMVQLSRTVSALVKPGYSPYEQYALSSRQQGPWTDIYSLGATLYQAIGGKRPSDAPSRVVADDYKPAAEVALSAYRPQFLTAIDQALKLKVEERPQSIAAWIEDLLPPELLATRRPTVVPALFKAKAPPPPPKRGAAAKPGPQRTSLRRRAVRWLEGIAREKPPAQTAKAVTPPKPVAPAAAALPAPIPATPEVPIPVPKALVKVPPASPKALARKGAPAADARKAAAQAKLGKAKVGAAGNRDRRPPPPKRSSLATKLMLGVGLSAILVSYQDQIRPLLPFQIGPEPVAAVAPTATPERRAEKRTETKGSERVLSTGSIRPPDPVPAERAQETTLAGHRGAVTAVAFAKDGQQVLSIGADGTLRWWDTSGKLLRTLETGESVPSALAVHERHAAVGHQDGSIVLWDVEQGSRVKSLKRNEALIWSVAFAGDANRIVSGGHDWSVTLWDGRREAGPLHLFEGHDNAVQAVAYVPRGPYIVSAGADRTIKLWDGGDYSLVRTYKGHRDFVSSLAVSADGALIASGSFDKTIRIWQAGEGGGYRTLRGHKGRVTAVAFSSDPGLLVSASEDGTARIWDWKRSRLVRTLAGHSGAVKAVAFSPDGRRVATAGEDGTVRIWDATTPARQSASRS